MFLFIYILSSKPLPKNCQNLKAFGKFKAAIDMHKIFSFLSGSSKLV